MTTTTTNTDKPTRPVRAVIYIRLSRYRGEDVDPSTSLERQQAACEAYCRANGWEIIEVVADKNVSGYVKGKRLEREGIKRVIELLPHVDRVVFTKLDRLARSVSDFYRLHEIADGHNAALVAIRDGIDMSSPMGKMIATILAAFAEFESAVISERTRDGKAFVSKIGRYVGGQVPFGYRVIDNPEGKGRVLTVDDDAAKMIRDAAKDILIDKPATSAYAIATRWNQARTDGERWTQSNVARVLLGDAVCGRKAWPAILDDDTILRLAAKLSPKAAPRLGVRRPERLLSGFLRCSSCDGPLQVGTNGNRYSDGRPRVPVTGYTCRRPGCTKKVSVSADNAERLIGQWFLDKHGDDYEARQVVRPGADVRELTWQAEIDQVAAQIGVAAANGGKLDELLRELEELRRELDRIQAEPVKLSTQWVWNSRTNGQRWAAADVQERQDMLRSEIVGISVRPGRPGRRLRTVEDLLERFAMEFQDQERVA